MEFHLGKASLPLVEPAQSSQADAGDAVVVVEHVEDVVHAQEVAAPENWWAAKGESPELGSRGEWSFLRLMQRHRQQLSNSYD